MCGGRGTEWRSVCVCGGGALNGEVYVCVCGRGTEWRSVCVCVGGALNGEVWLVASTDRAALVL